MDFHSRLIEEAVDQMASLPGIGRKTALRLVLHLLKREREDVDRFARAFTKLRNDICHCGICNNLSDAEVCNVCTDNARDKHTVCVVESIRELLAIEATQHYRGVYHVLGGVISPVEGVGPSDLSIEPLIARCRVGDVKEVIFALSTTMEGETTAFYLFRKLNDTGVNVSAIARGVAIGDELQYADELTLANSILRRQPYEANLTR
jgi:recombination protein RecR